MSSTTTKPSIIVIPGSFAPLAFWAPIIADLKAHGYDAHGIELETVGRRDKAPGLYDEAAKVAALASRLADEGRDVVLVRRDRSLRGIQGPREERAAACGRGKASPAASCALYV
jgi:hypothetical protein